MPDASSSPTPAPAPPRWSIERRLDFIASRLAWEGRINRLDLVGRFGVSPNQATADLKRFEELHPGALRYDTRAKTYRSGPGLAPPNPLSAAVLLRDLRLMAEGVLAPEDGVLALPPPAELAEPPLRPVPPAILAAVTAAIRETRVLSAIYQSFSTPKPRLRHLEPHALVFDGFRWHVRARDAEEDRFRDFVLGRLSEPKLEGPALANREADNDWRTRVELEITPHPGLAPHQRLAIAADYDMKDEHLTLRPRLAVAYYVKRKLGLTEGHRERSPRDQHIVLLSERVIPF